MQIARKTAINDPGYNLWKWTKVGRYALIEIARTGHPHKQQKKDHHQR